MIVDKIEKASNDIEQFNNQTANATQEASRPNDENEYNLESVTESIDELLNYQGIIKYDLKHKLIKCKEDIISYKNQLAQCKEIILSNQDNLNQDEKFNKEIEKINNEISTLNGLIETLEKSKKNIKLAFQFIKIVSKNSQDPGITIIQQTKMVKCIGKMVCQLEKQASSKNQQIGDLEIALQNDKNNKIVPQNAQDLLCIDIKQTLQNSLLSENGQVQFQPISDTIKQIQQESDQSYQISQRNQILEANSDNYNKSEKNQQQSNEFNDVSYLFQSE